MTHSSLVVGLSRELREKLGKMRKHRVRMSSNLYAEEAST